MKLDGPERSRHRGRLTVAVAVSGLLGTLSVIGWLLFDGAGSGGPLQSASEGPRLQRSVPRLQEPGKAPESSGVGPLRALVPARAFAAEDRDAVWAARAERLVGVEVRTRLAIAVDVAADVGVACRSSMCAVIVDVPAARHDEVAGVMSFLRLGPEPPTFEKDSLGRLRGLFKVGGDSRDDGWRPAWSKETP